MLRPGIFFHYMADPFRFPDRSRLKRFLERQIRKEGRATEAIHYIFCTDEYLHQINLQYLAHDTYTDIITFPLSKKGKPLVADIYISVDRVRDNASNFNTTFLPELYRVIFHGALHLCGYKDKTAKETVAMRKMEDDWLRLYVRST